MNGPRVHPSRLVLIGDPVAHSLSPAFQNAALAAANLPARYHAMRVAADELDGCIEWLRAEGVAGNVTVPHKERFAVRCDRRTPAAARVGAVNTFWFEDGALVGDNTDIDGAAAAIQHLMPTGVRGARCAILGAGGSAAAVVAVLRDGGAAEIRLASRNIARAVQLNDRLAADALVVADLTEATLGCDLVVNATPVGMRDDGLPSRVDALAAQTRVLDLVYRREGTPWVRAARARGLRADDGLRMLVEQGAAAFERWFGMPPDKAAMWSALAPEALPR